MAATINATDTGSAFAAAANASASIARFCSYFPGPFWSRNRQKAYEHATVPRITSPRPADARGRRNFRADTTYEHPAEATWTMPRSDTAQAYLNRHTKEGTQRSGGTQKSK